MDSNRLHSNYDLVNTTMHTWESTTDVVVDDCEFVKDVYEEIIKEELEGNVVIHRYEDSDPVEQQMHADYIKEHIDDEEYSEYRGFLRKHFQMLWESN